MEKESKGIFDLLDDVYNKDEEVKVTITIPKQYMNDAFRFCLTEFPINGEKKPLGKDRDQYGRAWNKEHNLLTFQELQEWKDNKYGFGILTGYGNLLVIDVDDYELRNEILELFEKDNKTFVVKTASGKYHLYYYCDEIFQKTYKGVVELFAKKGSKQVLSAVNNKFAGEEYGVYKDRPIANITKETVLELLKDYEDKNEEVAETSVYTDKSSALVDDINLNVNFLDFYNSFAGEALKAGERPKTKICPECHNQSSRAARYNNACAVYNDVINCSRCSKNWNTFSFLEHWCGVVEKWDRVKILAEYAGIDVDDPKYNTEEPDPPFPEFESRRTDESNDESLREVVFSLKGNQIMELNVPPRKYLLEVILPAESINMTSGEAGAGKSLYWMSILSALSQGKDFFLWRNQSHGYVVNNEFVHDELEEPEPIECLFMDGEMSIHDIKDRIPDLNMSQVNIFNRSFFETEQFKEMMSDLGFSGSIIKKGDLTSESYRDIWFDNMMVNKIKVVVIDNLASWLPGWEENAKKEYDQFNQWIIRLRGNGITVVLIHHLDKGGKDQRGHSGHIDNVDSTWLIRFPEKYIKEIDDVKFNLTFKKGRQNTSIENLHLLKNLTIKFNKETREWETTTGGEKEEAMWLLYYLTQKKDTGDSYSYDEIREIMKEKGYEKGYAKATITKKKNKFIKNEWINEEGNLSEKGETWLNNLLVESIGNEKETEVNG